MKNLKTLQHGLTQLLSFTAVKGALGAILIVTSVIQAIGGDPTAATATQAAAGALLCSE